ncbi:MAG: branched-chain amino acid ABC transporter ATP-binding protein/permease [Actinomycetota bacterium]
MTGRRFIAPAAFVLAAFAPLMLGSDATSNAAEGIALLLAALGLNLAVGYAGQPSLGQGAFAAVGAYGTAILVARSGWDPAIAVAASALMATAAGAVLARAVIKLRPAFVALATWLAAWTVSFAVSAFPRLTGGSQGLPVGAVRLHVRSVGTSIALGPSWVYEAGLVLVGIALGGTWLVVRRYRGGFAAMVSDPGAARAAGIPVERLRLGALTASALIGGLAGGLLTLRAGVADPTAYGPLLSVKLFIVVLLGGTARLYGPVAGLAAILVVTKIASLVASAIGGTSVQVEPFVAGAVLAGVLFLGRSGIVALVEGVSGGRRSGGHASEGAKVAAYRGAHVAIRDVGVSFGGIGALRGVSFVIEAGTCHGLIGPNGSGKTTLLRALGGAVSTDTGSFEIDGVPLAAESTAVRARLGIARTLQRSAVMGDDTLLDYVRAGAEPWRPGDMLRTLLSTPGARSEQRRIAGGVRSALEVAGLWDARNAPVHSLTGAERRRLQLARALAASPRVLLLDEPSAGLNAAETEHVCELIASLRDDGLTIVLVEHNLRLIAAVADQVSVLDAGSLIATGRPDEIASDAAVVSAYLGDEAIKIKARAHR